MDFIHFLGELMSVIQKKEKEKEYPKPVQPFDYTPTEAKIVEMLQDNTGAHILDSGGAYGRNWERNRAVQDFRDTPVSKVSIWKDGEIDFSINLFHYLREHLEFDVTSKDIQEAFEKFAMNKKMKDVSWLGCMEQFTKEFMDEPMSFNTYNFEYNRLSQILQGVFFYNGEDYYVLLQIHGGCDVRGGYTKPQCFRIGSFYDPHELIYGGERFNGRCNCTRVSMSSEIEVWNIETDEEGYDWSDFPPHWITQPKNYLELMLACMKPNSWDYEYFCVKCHQVIEFYADLS